MKVQPQLARLSQHNKLNANSPFIEDYEISNVDLPRVIRRRVDCRGPNGRVRKNLTKQRFLKAAKLLAMLARLLFLVPSRQMRVLHTESFLLCVPLFAFSLFDRVGGGAWCSVEEQPPLCSSAEEFAYFTKSKG